MKKIIKYNRFVLIDVLVFCLMIVLFVALFILVKNNGYIKKNNVFIGDDITATQNFNISEVSGFDAIARQVFYNKGCKKASTIGLRSDIIEFVNFGEYDISSITLYYRGKGILAGANIDYVPAGEPSKEKLIFFFPSYDLSGKTMMSKISDFVSDPLFNILDVQYVKDENGGIISAAILYEDKKLS